MARVLMAPSLLFFGVGGTQVGGELGTLKQVGLLNFFELLRPQTPLFLLVQWNKDFELWTLNQVASGCFKGLNLKS